MRIAVVGCGAVGSYYGALLSRSGADVHFLLRSDFDVVRRQGIQIISKDEVFYANPRCSRDPNQIGPCDLVVIALKTTANAELGRLISPLIGPNTGLLTLQNGLGNEEDLADLFGPNNVMGGLCFVCLNRIEPGKILHTAHGHIYLGEFQRPSSKRTLQIANCFRRAGISVTMADRLELARWEKLVWNIPFNGLSVASAAGWDALSAGEWDRVSLFDCLSTKELLDDPRWNEVVQLLMHEVIMIAGGLGLAFETNLVDAQIARTREMGCYRPSTLIDYELGREVELSSLFERPLEKARGLGLSTPWLERLCKVLRELTNYPKVKVEQAIS